MHVHQRSLTLNQQSFCAVKTPGANVEVVSAQAGNACHEIKGEMGDCGKRLS